MISLFASTLNGLLKKQYLISPAELQLQWRPLYKLMETVLDSPYEDVGLYFIPSSLDTVLRNVVKLCRDYFPIEATQEMLEEWRPLLCPFDMTMPMGVSLFETFLPTKTEPKNHPKSYLLWFEEFIGLWRMCHNKPSWEFDLLLLFSRLADNNIGQINWEPVMPLMFCKILNNFGLPVGYRYVNINFLALFLTKMLLFFQGIKGVKLVTSMTLEQWLHGLLPHLEEGAVAKITWMRYLKLLPVTIIHRMLELGIPNSTTFFGDYLQLL